MEHMCDICDEMPAMTYHDNLGAICYDCRKQYADKIESQGESIWDATINGSEQD